MGGNVLKNLDTGGGITQREVGITRCNVQYFFCGGTRTVVVQFDYISVHSIVQFYPQLQYYTILWLSVARSVDVVGCGGWLAGWMNGWESFL